MTKGLFKWMMAIAIIASPMVFTACGDDDESGSSQTVNAAKADVTLALPLGEELAKYCEGTITYTDAKGDSVIEELSSGNVINNVWTKTIKDYMLPAPIMVALEFKAKDVDAIGKTIKHPNVINVSFQYKDANGKNIGDLNQQALFLAEKGNSTTLNMRTGTQLFCAFTIPQRGFIAGESAHESTVPSRTVSFEYQKLNDLGFWAGEENENGYESWGSMVYPCEYQESYVKLNTTFGGYYWSGYAISNRTEKGFTPGDFTPTGMPDQFNNVTGKAHSGKNFCVVMPYGETIHLGAKSSKAKGAQLKGFWYTNSSYTAHAIENGDGMSTVPGGFTKDDWFKCIVTGMKADSTTVSVEIMLAQNGDYVKDWQFVDLSSMGQIKSLSFSFDGTKKNEHGVTTPAYMCIDDIEE